ncbi:hypothetical protein J7L00_04220 [Candidatus Bathyarchaeota archaeon]|nr:hypothetical protein [Candidatus Bathyarchaeota archaeon]
MKDKKNSPDTPISLIGLAQRVAALEANQKWIRDKLDSMDKKLWALIVIYLGSIIPLIIKLLLMGGAV